MWSRTIQLGKGSFFLFGPRGVGKSTLLSMVLPQAKLFSLLSQSEYLQFISDPTAFKKQVLGLKKGSWIIVDEIQKIPMLLDEIHFIMNEKGEKYYRFAITGSSARKLRQKATNLLAGRVLHRNLFPLTYAELKFSRNEVDGILCFGTLPTVCNLKGAKKEKIAFLESYMATYLQQEIQQEALAKNLDSFVRFLKVAGIMNAQIVNVSSIARDSGVARTSVQGYFDVLVDTLTGSWLPAWQPRAKVKESQHPKFYFFDPGVVRTLTSMLRDPLDSIERGFLLETYIFHELRAAIEYREIGGELSYWRSGNRELDFVWSRGKKRIGIEVKAATKWRKEFSDVGNELVEKGILQKAYGVYLGETKLVDGSVTVFPVIDFLDRLSKQEILGE